MSQLYSDPARESDPYTLPDVEVFYMPASEFINVDESTWMHERMADDTDADANSLAGWYYWTCMPGCLPDSDASGPFKTEADAIEDARNID